MVCIERYKKILRLFIDDNERELLKTFEKALDDDTINKIVDELLEALINLDEQSKNILEKFITSSKDAKTVLKRRLKKFLENYFKVGDEAYILSFNSVGVAHYRAGVEPYLFLSGFSLFIHILLKTFQEKRDISELLIRETIKSEWKLTELLIKKFIFELVIILDAYWQELVDKLLNAERKTLIDPLTSLYNRRFLELELPNRLSQDKYTVIMLDLDDFKLLNDKHGHLVGDLILKWFAQQLKRSFKGKDYIVRYGGDEFIVVLVDVHRTLANRLMRVSQGAIESTAIELPDNRELKISFSWGSAQYPKDSRDLLQLIKIADKRMYLKKRRKKRDMK